MAKSQNGTFMALDMAQKVFRFCFFDLKLGHEFACCRLTLKKKDSPYQWNSEQRDEISDTVNYLLTETSVAKTDI